MAEGALLLGARARAAWRDAAHTLGGLPWTVSGRPPAANARSRAFARRQWEARLGLAPGDLACLTALPDWVSTDSAALRRRACLTGAVAASPALRATIDGRVLGAIASEIGETTVDAVLDLPPGLGLWTAVPWGDHPLQVLHGLGGAVLLAHLCEVGGSAPLYERLTRLFPDPPAECAIDRLDGALDSIVRKAEALLCPT